MQGVPVVLLLRSEVDAEFRIPAMRVAKTVAPGAPAIAWFVPTAAGTFPIEVSTGSGKCDGVLTVKE